MPTILAILSIAIPVVAVGTGVWCLFFCRACEKRQQEINAIARQIEVATQLNREDRERRRLESAKIWANAFIIYLKRPG